jgi:hypothetical protein
MDIYADSDNNNQLTNLIIQMTYTIDNKAKEMTKRFESFMILHKKDGDTKSDILFNPYYVLTKESVCLKNSKNASNKALLDKASDKVGDERFFKPKLFKQILNRSELLDDLNYVDINNLNNNVQVTLDSLFFVGKKIKMDGNDYFIKEVKWMHRIKDKGKECDSKSGLGIQNWVQSVFGTGDGTVAKVADANNANNANAANNAVANAANNAVANAAVVDANAANNVDANAANNVDANAANNVDANAAVVDANNVDANAANNAVANASNNADNADAVAVADANSSNAAVANNAVAAVAEVANANTMGSIISSSIISIESVNIPNDDKQKIQQMSLTGYNDSNHYKLVKYLKINNIYDIIKNKANYIKINTIQFVFVDNDFELYGIFQFNPKNAPKYLLFIKWPNYIMNFDELFDSINTRKARILFGSNEHLPLIAENALRNTLQINDVHTTKKNPICDTLVKYVDGVYNNPENLIVEPHIFDNKIVVFDNKIVDITKMINELFDFLFINPLISPTPLILTDALPPDNDNLTRNQKLHKIINCLFQWGIICISIIASSLRLMAGGGGNKNTSNIPNVILFVIKNDKIGILSNRKNGKINIIFTQNEIHKINPNIQINDTLYQIKDTPVKPESTNEQLTIKNATELSESTNEQQYINGGTKNTRKKQNQSSRTTKKIRGGGEGDDKEKKEPQEKKQQGQPLFLMQPSEQNSRKCKDKLPKYSVTLQLTLTTNPESISTNNGNSNRVFPLSNPNDTCEIKGQKLGESLGFNKPTPTNQINIADSKSTVTVTKPIQPTVTDPVQPNPTQTK